MHNIPLIISYTNFNWHVTLFFTNVSHFAGDICNVLEVIPGKSPFMCSKATSSVSSLIECHDACVHGRCEAFQYLTKDDQSTACEIFFDKSCIELLNKKKENYYVKRCTNPKGNLLLEKYTHTYTRYVNFDVIEINEIEFTVYTTQMINLWRTEWFNAILKYLLIDDCIQSSGIKRQEDS